MSTPLWQPSIEEKENTLLTQFSKKIQAKYDLPDSEYSTVHQWSIDYPELFWEEVWKDSRILASKSWNKVMGKDLFNVRNDSENSGWFEGARLNYAENLLLRNNDENVALSFVAENGTKHSMSYAELRTAVSQCASGMKGMGVSEMDRVAAVIPNCPEAVIGLLAASSIGAIWSSCSPDFGIKGINDRLGQISPKILITVNAYRYNGKEHDCLTKIREVSKLIPSIEAVYVVNFTDTKIEFQGNEKPWAELLDYSINTTIFAQLPFNHPLYILYSSGTTGLPKSIVHGAGAVSYTHLRAHET